MGFPVLSGRRRLPTFAVGLVAIAATASATAASLGGVTPAGLVAGHASVTPCDGNGMTIGYVTSGGLLTGVTISGLADPLCEGGQVALVVRDGASAVLATGSATLPGDGDGADNTVTVATSPGIDADLVAGVSLRIVGP